MQILRITTILLALLIASNLFASEKSTQALEKCLSTTNEHVARLTCLEKLAEKSNNELTKAENKLKTNISKSPDATIYSAEQLKALNEASKAFNQYKQMQCTFEIAAQLGTNGGYSQESLCEINLNESRIKLLKEQAAWFE